MIEYSPTQKRLLNLLGDGQPHTKKELQGCCNERSSNSSNTVRVHLSLLRKKLDKDAVNGARLNIIPIISADWPTYQLVKIAPATLNDVKSL